MTPTRTPTARPGRGRLLARCLTAVLVFLLAAATSEAKKTPTPKVKPTPTVAFSLATVMNKANQLAKSPFQEPRGQVPEWLLKASYDQWRDIRFRPDRSLWRDKKLPFEVQFFHPGLFYDRVVTINVVDAQGIRPHPFSPSNFDYGRTDFASRVPQNLGYAGFRVHAPIKTAQYYDEVIVFLGASYFRALGKNQVFGLSARGLAVDTALPSGEEFPYFREFWLVTPEADAKSLTIYALLDSPSLTGAYRFVVTPGETTAVDVDAQLFLRRDVKKLGIAPLTSMFFHGENTNRFFDDFRPETHDSDGLLLSLSNGEWLWRPLDNPTALHVSAFQMVNPRGFGLLQRDRDFDHHQDIETRAELRPSVWIAPRNDWGAGHVELVEIPTKGDANDNIVAFWVPDRPARATEMFVISYTMSWYDEDAARPPAGRVVGTRRDMAGTEDVHRFVVDFAGKQLAELPAEEVLRAVVNVASGPESGEILEQVVTKNPVNQSWRLTFRVRPKGNQPVELRAFLDKADQTLTETWSYVILP